MEYLPRVSEALYVGLCHYIGTPTDLDVTIMKSGSYKEGFRFKSSDLDAMIW